MPFLPLFGTASGGRRALALKVSTDAGGKAVLAQLDGFCAAPAAGDRLLALVVATDAGGKPVLAFSRQQCAGTGTTFETGKRYLAQVVGADAGGKPVFASTCKQCEDLGTPPVPICDCSYPSTLNINVVKSVHLADQSCWIGEPLGHTYDIDIEDDVTTTMTWGTYLIKHCDCFTCQDCESEPGITECDCPDFEAKPDFHHFCFLDGCYCYACYHTPLPGYVSEPVPLTFPRLVTNFPEECHVEYYTCEITFVLVPVCGPGEAITWHLYYFDACDGFCAEGDGYFNNCGGTPGYADTPTTACPEPPGSPGDPGAPIDFVFSGPYTVTIWQS